MEKGDEYEFGIAPPPFAIHGFIEPSRAWKPRARIQDSRNEITCHELPIPNWALPAVRVEGYHIRSFHVPLEQAVAQLCDGGCHRRLVYQIACLAGIAS